MFAIFANYNNFKHIFLSNCRRSSRILFYYVANVQLIFKFLFHRSFAPQPAAQREVHSITHTLSLLLSASYDMFYEYYMFEHEILNSFLASSIKLVFGQSAVEPACLISFRVQQSACHHHHQHRHAITSTSSVNGLIDTPLTLY